LDGLRKFFGNDILEEYNLFESDFDIFRFVLDELKDYSIIIGCLNLSGLRVSGLPIRLTYILGENRDLDEYLSIVGDTNNIEELSLYFDQELLKYVGDVNLSRFNLIFTPNNGLQWFGMRFNVDTGKYEPILVLDFVNNPTHKDLKNILLDVNTKVGYEREYGLNHLILGAGLDRYYGVFNKYLAEFEKLFGVLLGVEGSNNRAGELDKLKDVVSQIFTHSINLGELTNLVRAGKVKFRDILNQVYESQNTIVLKDIENQPIKAIKFLYIYNVWSLPTGLTHPYRHEDNTNGYWINKDWDRDFYFGYNTFENPNKKPEDIFEDSNYLKLFIPLSRSVFHYREESTKTYTIKTYLDGFIYNLSEDRNRLTIKFNEDGDYVVVIAYKEKPQAGQLGKLVGGYPSIPTNGMTIAQLSNPNLFLTWEEIVGKYGIDRTNKHQFLRYVVQSLGLEDTISEDYIGKVEQAGQFSQVLQILVDNKDSDVQTYVLKNVEPTSKVGIRLNGTDISEDKVDSTTINTILQSIEFIDGKYSNQKGIKLREDCLLEVRGVGNKDITPTFSLIQIGKDGQPTIDDAYTTGVGIGFYLTYLKPIELQPQYMDRKDEIIEPIILLNNTYGLFRKGDMSLIVGVVDLPAIKGITKTNLLNPENGYVALDKDGKIYLTTKVLQGWWEINPDKIDLRDELGRFGKWNYIFLNLPLPVNKIFKDFGSESDRLFSEYITMGNSLNTHLWELKLGDYEGKVPLNNLVEFITTAKLTAVDKDGKVDLPIQLLSINLTTKYKKNVVIGSRGVGITQIRLFNLPLPSSMQGVIFNNDF